MDAEVIYSNPELSIKSFYNTANEFFSNLYLKISKTCETHCLAVWPIPLWEISKVFPYVKVKFRLSPTSTHFFLVLLFGA